MPDADPGLMTIFAEALERPDPGARAAYLDVACGDDAVLRRRVEALLAAHDGAGRFLEPDPAGTAGSGLAPTQEAPRASTLGGPPPSGTATAEQRPDGSPPTLTDPAPATPPGRFVPGQVIAGRFTLLEVLGEGGMGTVYLAEQTEPVRRQVALKLIRVGMGSRAVLARFDAERQALALMDHPNIARVYDGGTTASGQPFFAMELVSGVPITEYCDRHRLPLRARLELFVAVCQAVQHAHQKGIIHRDLKPGNVMVTEVDGRPTPKVIDFGVAKATEFHLTDQSLGDTGAIVGTPTYMSPEQADPSSMDIDTRTDIYALGVILYELLAGSPPLDPSQIRRGAFLEMLRMVRELDPPRPSLKVSTSDALPGIAADRGIDPEQLKRALRGDLDWIVMKALEKDRTRRYETANGFAADLRRHLASEPVLAAPPSQAYRMRKFVRKHRAAVIAASLVVLAMLAGIAGTTWGLIEAMRQEGHAQALAAKEATARGEAQALAAKEATARGEAQAQERIALERAELLAREDYVNRVNRAYREVQEDNVALAEDLLHGCEPGRRGWEWHFVERLCNSERRILDLGNRSVNALAFGPDGTWAVAASGAQPFGNPAPREPTVEVREVDSGLQRKALPGARGVVYDVAVSPDGKKVAAGCSAGLVLVWDVDTAKTEWTRTEPGLNAMSVAFSPDGKSLATGYGFYSESQIGRVKVRDVASGAEIKAFAGPRGGVNKVAFHPDGRRLAVAGSEVVEVWDLGDSSKLFDLKGHRKWVYCLAYSPDGKWLATGGWDNTVKLRDAATGVEALTIFAHEGFVLGLAFSPDGRNLVTASEDRSVRLWEVPSGRRLSTFHGHSDFVQAVAFRRDGREVGTGGNEGSIRFWDLRTSRPVVVEHTGWVDRLAFRRDGLRVLSEAGIYRTDAAPTKGWDPVTGELDATLAGARFDPLPAGYVRGPLGYMERLNSKRFNVTSPDGKLVASAGDQGGSQAARSKEYSLSSVIIREAESGRVLQTLAGHSADVVSLGFSPDGRRLATASFDRTIKLWDTTTWQDVFTLRGHSAGVVSLAFSPDGNRIVSGGIDCTARVWNATPLSPEVIAEHDARYRKKVETLVRLKGTNDDVKRAEILAGSGQWGMAAGAFARAVAKEPGKLPLRYQLIEAILESGETGRVGSACDDLIARFGNTNDPLQDLGVAGFCRLARAAGTDPEKRAAVHDMVVAPNGQARLSILSRSGQWDLISQYHARIITDNPDDARARYGLGFALSAQRKYDEASEAYRAAIRLNPDYAEAYCNLGSVLANLGRFAESLAARRRGHELGMKQPDWRYPSADWVRSAERMAALEGKLPGFLKGEYQPEDNADRLGLADVCRSKQLYHAAARLSADAFAADSRLADDTKAFHRYNAACFASLAADGQGEDAAGLDEKERARLRRQALDWLRADLALRTGQAESGQPADRAEVRRTMEHWRQDSDLGPVRDPEALKKLPEAERDEWQKLWGEVEALLKRVQ